MKKDHLIFVKSKILEILKPTSYVIDATCGNGFDTLFLANLISSGKIYCYDIQQKAIENTKELLNKHMLLDLNKISFINSSHEDFSSIPSDINIDLIIYNLGYLPKGDKSITTKLDSSLKSIQNGLEIINQDGSIIITMYPGHIEGKKEKEALIDFISTLDDKIYKASHRTFSEKEIAPSVIIIKKN